jgi:heme exporter protein D
MAATPPSGVKASYDWSAVALAVLIVLVLMVGYFIVQAINRWVVKRLARSIDHDEASRHPVEWPATPSLDRHPLPRSNSPSHSLH